MRSLHKNIINQAVISEELLAQESHFYTADGLSTLQLAAREGRANVVMHLLAANLDNNIDEFEEKPTERHHPDAAKTPFYLAVEYGHTFLAMKLLACGANRDLAIEMATKLSQDHLIEAIGDVPFQEHLTALRMIRLGEIIQRKNVSHNEVSLVVNRLNTLLNDADAISVIIESLLARSLYHLADVLLKHHKPRCEESIYTAGYWAAMAGSTLLSQTCNTNDDWLLTLRQLNSERQIHALKFTLGQAPATCKTQFTKIMRTEIQSPQDEKLTDEQIHFYQCASRNQLDDNLFDFEHDDYLILLRYALKKYNYIAVQEILNKTYTNSRNNFLNYLLEEDEFKIARILFSEFNFSYTLSVPGEVFGIDNFPQFLRAFSSPEGYAHQLINAGIKQDELPSKELLLCARTLLPNPSLYVATVLRCITNRYQIPPLHESNPSNRKDLNFNPARAHQVYHVVTDTKLSAHDFSLISIMLERFGVALKEKELEVLEPEVDKAKAASHFNKLPADIWGEIIPWLSGQSLAAIPAVSQRFYQYKLKALRQDKFGVKWQEQEKLWRDIRAHEEEFKQCLDQARLLMMLVDSIQDDMKPGWCPQAKYKWVPLATLIPTLLIAISIASLIIMLERDKMIIAELGATMTSYGKNCIDLRLYNNSTCGTGFSDNTYFSIANLPECSTLCRQYRENHLFVIGVVSGFLWGIFAISLPCEAYQIALQAEDKTTLNQSSLDVHENLQALQQAFPQLLQNTLPTSRLIDLLREAQAVQVVTQTNRRNLNRTSTFFANQLAARTKFYAPSSWRLIEGGVSNRANDPVVININDGASQPDQNKRDKKIQEGRRRIFGNTYVSPARLMDNLFSMFKSDPEVSFDHANSRLLCVDDSDSESDHDSGDETLELIRQKR